MVLAPAPPPPPSVLAATAAAAADAAAAPNSEQSGGGGKAKETYLHKLGIGGPSNEEIIEAGLIPPGWSMRNDGAVGDSSAYASTAAAVAAASALSASAAAEQLMVEVGLREAKRLIESAVAAAVELCERQSGRFTPQSSAADVASGGVGVVLRAAGGLLRTSARPTLNLPLLLVGSENKHSTDIETTPPPPLPCVCISGGLLRTSTRPTLNFLLLIRACA